MVLANIPAEIVFFSMAHLAYAAYAIRKSPLLCNPVAAKMQTGTDNKNNDDSLRVRCSIYCQRITYVYILRMMHTPFDYETDISTYTHSIYVLFENPQLIGD